MKNPDYIHISLKPIAGILLILALLIIVGFVFDSIRSEKKIKKIDSHAKLILNTHKQSIIGLLDKPSELKTTLERINTPEKNIYNIDVLDSRKSPWKLYDYTGYSLEMRDVNTSLESKIQGKISDNESVNIIKGEEFMSELVRYNSKNFILSIHPIIENGTTYGYLLVSVNKTYDL